LECCALIRRLPTQSTLYADYGKKLVTTMKQLKAIIVDDEWLIRSEIKKMLSKYPTIDVVGEAAFVSDAFVLVEKFHPDVIFLDIQLSGETCFELLEQANITCDVVFITAFDQYAIRAFEVNALDYLLKPIIPERFDKTIQRLLNREEIISSNAQKLTKDDIVCVMSTGSLTVIKISGLRCITACGNYSEVVHEDCKKSLISKSLLEWEESLPEKYFLHVNLHLRLLLVLY